MSECHFLAESIGPALANEKGMANIIQTAERHLLFCSLKPSLKSCLRRFKTLGPVAAH